MPQVAGVLKPAGLRPAGVAMAVILVTVVLTRTGLTARRHLLTQAIQRWRAQTETHMGRAQAFLYPDGPRRDIAVMRERLQRELERTRRAVLDGPSEAARLYSQITNAVLVLDAELAVLSREPDAGRLYAAASAIAPRVDEFCRLAGDLGEATRNARAVKPQQDAQRLPPSEQEGPVTLQAAIDRLRRTNG